MSLEQQSEETILVEPDKMIILHTLVESKIIHLPLRIKLDFTKQFVKPLPNKGDYFKYCAKKFFHLSDELNHLDMFSEK